MRAVLRAGVVVTAVVCCSIVGAAPVGAKPSGTLTPHVIVTGLPDVPPGSVFSGVGPFGLAFNQKNRLLFSDADNLGFYSVPLSGATAPTPLSTGNAQTGLTWSRSGELFAARFQAGDIVQINPATGAFIRSVVPPGTFPCLTELATDPISGDLFFGQPNSGGACPGAPGIIRVEHPTSANPTFVTYALPNNFVIGVAFAPNGTLYAVEGTASGTCAVRVTGTQSPMPPVVTTLACFADVGIFAGIDDVAVSATPGNAPTLFVAGPDGNIYEIDQTTNPATVTTVVTGGTRTDAMLVGPDHCLYATQSTSIERLTNADGSCSFTPVHAGHGNIG